jgi:hypothetical protein
MIVGVIAIECGSGLRVDRLRQTIERIVSVIGHMIQRIGDRGQIGLLVVVVNRRLTLSCGGANCQRNEARAVAGDRRQRVQEVAGRARQPVEARHYQHVTFFKLIENTAQLRAVARHECGNHPPHFEPSIHGLAKTSWQAVPALAAKAPAVRAALP